MDVPVTLETLTIKKKRDRTSRVHGARLFLINLGIQSSLFLMSNTYFNKLWASCEGCPLCIISLLHFWRNWNSQRANWKQLRDKFWEWQNTQEINVAAKPDAILLADTSPQLEEKNLDGLLKLELLSLERQISKMKDILAHERIIRDNLEKIFVLEQRLDQDIMISAGTCW